MTDTAGHTPAEPTSDAMPGVPDDLARCAMVVESAMEHLLKENHPPLAIASACWAVLWGCWPGAWIKTPSCIFSTLPRTACVQARFMPQHRHRLLRKVRKPEVNP